MPDSSSNPIPNHKLTYTVEGALELLEGVSRTRLYDLINSGKIKSKKAGRRRLLIGDSLRAYASEEAA